MEPIINPWMVYLIGNIENISTFFGVIGSFILFYWIVCLIIIIALSQDELIEVPKVLNSKFLRWFSGIFGMFFITIATLIPTSKTLTAMVIANEVTYDRVDSLKATVGDIHNIVKQDIIDMIQEIKRDEVKTEVK